MSRRDALLRVLLWWGVGFALATVAWFVLSPALSSQQEDLISWLLTGSTLVIWGVWLFRARERKTNRSPSS
jgi:predicted metal-binding membrane protein